MNGVLYVHGARKGHKFDNIAFSDKVSFAVVVICESIYGGFIMNCPDKNLCREIIPHLAPIQMGEVEPKDFPVATREEMQALWDAEEEVVMQAEFKML